MWTRNLSFLVLACIVHARPAVAGVLVVSSTGTGSFTDLPAAVAAAVDGDVLLVKSGTYSATTINDKSIDVVADAGANAVIQGSMAVVNVSATRAVTLTGLILRASTHLSPALRISTNTGSVRIQGCSVEGFDRPDCATPFFVPGGAGLAIDASLDVCLARCTVSGGRSGDAGPYAQVGNAGDALDASASRVALYENQFVGGRGGSIGGSCGSLWYGYGGDGGDALRASTCPVFFVSGGVALGGRAGDALQYAGCPGAGVRLFTTPLSTLGSTLTRGALAQFGVAACSCYSDVCPTNSTWQNVSGSARRLVAPRVVREHAAARIDVFGVPGDQVELRFSFRGAFDASPTGVGVGLLRRERPNPVQPMGVIGPSGQLSISWDVPEIGSGPAGQRIFAQADFIEPGGRVLRGPPATIVLLDSSL